jgi:hypothetical protein
MKLAAAESIQVLPILNLNVASNGGAQIQRQVQLSCFSFGAPNQPEAHVQPRTVTVNTTASGPAEWVRGGSALSLLLALQPECHCQWHFQRSGPT